ncbi:MAG: TIGR04282 family arsenosugar biosynthesis glycosyltransferase [Flavitalea sp.]
MKRSLIIFAKNEVHGKVKTRLAATTSDDTALVVYKTLMEHTHKITRVLPVQKKLYYSDYIEQNDCWENDVFDKHVQIGADLGSRMLNSFEEVFDGGAEDAVIIGTDCMELSSGIIVKAFEYLIYVDIVIGPAKDGGYYLLAMKGAHKELFENIDWSTELVLKQTLNICEQLGLSVQLLEELSDIDNEEDWLNASSQKESLYD